MKRYIYGICAIFGGILWVVFKYLINHLPQPFSYDDYNRMFTLPLILMLIGFIGVPSLLLKSLTRVVVISSFVAIIGLSFLLIGNILEFWIVLFQSHPNAYEAFKTGNINTVFIGSYLGWLIFCIGLLLIAITSFIIGIVMIKHKIANYWNVFVLFFGIVGLFSFGYEILLVPFGIGWVIMGYYLILNGREKLLD
jgi:hypothetical protein